MTATTAVRAANSAGTADHSGLKLGEMDYRVLVGFQHGLARLAFYE